MKPIYELIGERIRQAREARGLTQEQLAAKVHISQSTLGRYEQGERRPDLKVLMEIGRVLGKPLAYFLDENYQAPPPTDLLGMIREQLGDLLQVKYVPVYAGEVPAGKPAWVPEDVIGWLPVPETMQADAVVRVRGVSMVEAGILPGDYVLVKRADAARPGSVVVARIGDELTCKVYDVDENGMVWLRARNRGVPDIPLHGDEGAEVVGIVVGVFRDWSRGEAIRLEAPSE